MSNYLPRLMTLLLCIPAMVWADSGDKLGVWTGLLGSQKIVACFTKQDGKKPFGSGSYYNLDHMMPIALAKARNEPQWEEYSPDGVHNPTGVWTLRAAGNDTLIFRWNQPGVADSVPVQLKRVTGTADDDYASCGSDAYAGVLEHARTVTRGPVTTFGRAPYRSLSYRIGDAEIQSIEMVDTKYAGINAVLANSFNNDIQSENSCFRAKLESGGYGDANSINNSIEFLTGHFIVVKLSWSDGGCSHKGGEDFTTYDLRTGGAVKFADWVQGNLNRGEDDEEGMDDIGKKSVTKLQKLVRRLCLQKAVGSAAELIDVCDQRGMHVQRLEDRGLSIVVGNEEFDGVEVVVPYRRMLPFLTPLGKREVLSLIHALAARLEGK